MITTFSISNGRERYGFKVQGSRFSRNWALRTLELISQTPNAVILSHPGRNERGESRREGRQNQPPLPNPLLFPASGREGENMDEMTSNRLAAFQGAAKSRPGTAMLHSALPPQAMEVNE
jgi:hypothetical protein